MDELKSLEDRIDVAYDDLDIQLKAATSRQDVEAIRYLKGKMQGLAMVYDFISAIRD